MRWLRRLALIGGVASGVASMRRNRSGGSPAGGAGGADGGPGGSGRRAPLGGPLSPSAAARAKPEPTPEEAVDVTQAASAPARTLVAVPPLADEDSADERATDSGPLLSVVSDIDADADAIAGADDEGGGRAAGASDIDRSWVEPLEGGSCPLSHPVKANNNSGIYHVPEGRSYKRTAAERCYASAKAAEADGYRPAKA